MNLLPGTILRSTAIMDDPNFMDALLFITEYNDSGAIGFVFNKPFARNLNELLEFRHSRVFPLYEGGPVEKEKLFFIHQRPDIIEGGNLINGKIYLGGDIKQAVHAINNKSITAADIKIFVGYCGWDKDELEAEIEEGSWESFSVEIQPLP